MLEELAAAVLPVARDFGVALTGGHLVGLDGHRLTIVQTPEIEPDGTQTLLPGASNWPHEWAALWPTSTKASVVTVQHPELHRQILAMDALARATVVEQAASLRKARAAASTRKQREEAQSALQRLPPAYQRVEATGQLLLLSDAIGDEQRGVSIVKGPTLLTTPRTAIKSQTLVEASRLFRRCRCPEIEIQHGHTDGDPLVFVARSTRFDAQIQHVVLPLRA